MEHDFWAERWRNNQHGFHLDEANRHLVRHVSRLAPAPTRVFVPLCGMSRDLGFLRDLGHEVVGVEFIEEAALRFFDENGLEPAASRLGPHPTLRADRITIILDDLFALDAAAVGRFSAIYDRAALVAVEPDLHAAYLRKLRELAHEDARLLLIGFDHDIDTGPPFSLPGPALAALAAGLFSFEQLADLDLLPSETRFRERGATRVREQVWLGRPVVGSP